MNSLSRVRLFATPWTVVYQAPLSMESSRQEYWSGLPFPSPGDLPDPGIEPRSPALQAWILNLVSPDSQTDIARQIEKDLEELTQSRSLRYLGYVPVLSLVRLFATPRTIVHQTPLSMKLSRQKYCSSRLPFPIPGDLPDPGIKPMSPASSALPKGFFTTVHMESPEIK